MKNWSNYANRADISRRRWRKRSADYLIHDDYVSAEDIPLVRQKSDEVKTVKEKHRKAHLFSAVCAAAAAVCTVVGMTVSTHPSQVALYCFSASVFLILSVFQFIQYFKN